MDMLAVFTAVANQEQAEQLARAAIEQRLAACVQVEAVHSTYRWQGDVVNEPEVRVMFKTNRAAYPALEALLGALHPYDIPAIFALPVAEASATYVDWLQDLLSHPASNGR